MVGSSGTLNTQFPMALFHSHFPPAPAEAFLHCTTAVRTSACVRSMFFKESLIHQEVLVAEEVSAAAEKSLQREAQEE